MSSELLRRGLLVLSHVAGLDPKVDLGEAQRRARVSANAVANEQSIAEWYADAQNYLVLQDWIPRLQPVADQWSGLAGSYLPCADIRSLINDDEIDPHLISDLSSLRNLIQQVGYDADKNTTTTLGQCPHLILFGTGDGTRVKEILTVLDPVYLTIVVTEWEDFASSFWHLDWGSIWNERCSDPNRSIFILKAEDANSLAAYLADSALPLLEHAITYCVPTSAESLIKLRSSFNSDLIKRVVQYTGFVMDEYNMIWNSWHSLLQKPRIFRSPSLSEFSHINCIVCGSGPSLDDCLPHIKNLSSTHLIVACASNYGTLRRHGIDVDVLCLLERGDFMIEQYRQVVEECGSGQTRLLASVTTPAELHGLFDDAMVYFRPALTPLAIFADTPQQVLSNEGPQSINTGVAFSAAIGAKSIVLAGVDLGVVNRERVRSRSAIGESPRDFPLECKGNLCQTAYTNSMLIDGKLIVESLASQLLKQNVGLYNVSNGIKIEGFVPSTIEAYEQLQNCTHDQITEFKVAKDKLWRWWDRQGRYQPDRFMAMWTASRPRQHTHQLIKSLKHVLTESTPWLPQTCSQITHLLNCKTIPRTQQFPRRIIRGHILKLTLAVTRQLIVMKDEPLKASTFENSARRLLCQRLDQLEAEIYSLLDSLEKLRAS